MHGARHVGRAQARRCVRLPGVSARVRHEPLQDGEARPVRKRAHLAAESRVARLRRPQAGLQQLLQAVVRKQPRREQRLELRLQCRVLQPQPLARVGRLLQRRLVGCAEGRERRTRLLRLHLQARQARVRLGQRLEDVRDGREEVLEAHAKRAAAAAARRQPVLQHVSARAAQGRRHGGGGGGGVRVEGRRRGAAQATGTTDAGCSRAPADVVARNGGVWRARVGEASDGARAAEGAHGPNQHGLRHGRAEEQAARRGVHAHLGRVARWGDLQLREQRRATGDGEVARNLHVRRGELGGLPEARAGDLACVPRAQGLVAARQDDVRRRLQVRPQRLHRGLFVGEAPQQVARVGDALQRHDVAALGRVRRQQRQLHQDLRLGDGVVELLRHGRQARGAVAQLHARRQAHQHLLALHQHALHARLDLVVHAAAV